MNKTVIFSEVFDSKKKIDFTNLDTSEIQKLSGALPKDGNIDINNAEVLATKFLRGADLCGELMALATAFVAKNKDTKQKAYNQAFLIKSAENSSIKTDRMRVAFAELDDDYQEACVEYNKAIAMHRWIDSKYNSFNKMHYLCRNILKRGYEHENAAGWNGKEITNDKQEGW